MAAHVVWQNECYAVFPWRGVVKSVARLELEPCRDTALRVVAERSSRYSHALASQDQDGWYFRALL